MKELKMKTRVIKRFNFYYPQYKFFFWWRHFEEDQIRVCFLEEKHAHKYIAWRLEDEKL